MTLAVGDAFYGLFGWLRLGVTIDLALLAGAALLALIALRPARSGQTSVVGV
jgi:hypothetical protein